MCQFASAEQYPHHMFSQIKWITTRRVDVWLNHWWCKVLITHRPFLIDDQLAKNLICQNAKNSQSFKFAIFLLYVMRICVLSNCCWEILIDFDVIWVPKKFYLSNSDVVFNSTKFNSKVSVWFIFDKNWIPRSNVWFSFNGF